MARDAQAYADQALKLAPPGDAFPRSRLAQFAALFLGLGDEAARIDARAMAGIEEAFPNTTVELLGDWEAMAGLPDPAIPAPVTLGDRRAALLDRLTSRGDISPAGFRAIAAVYGYVATITMYRPFIAGVSHAGDGTGGPEAVFWWVMNVTVPIGTTTPIVALEHAVKRLAPLHTYVTFTYGH